MTQTRSKQLIPSLLVSLAITCHSSVLFANATNVILKQDLTNTLLYIPKILTQTQQMYTLLNNPPYSDVTATMSGQPDATGKTPNWTTVPWDSQTKSATQNTILNISDQQFHPGIKANTTPDVPGLSSSYFTSMFNSTSDCSSSDPNQTAPCSSSNKTLLITTKTTAADQKIQLIKKELGSLLIFNTQINTSNTYITTSIPAIKKLEVTKQAPRQKFNLLQLAKERNQHLVDQNQLLVMALNNQLQSISNQTVIMAENKLIIENQLLMQAGNIINQPFVNVVQIPDLADASAAPKGSKTGGS